MSVMEAALGEVISVSSGNAGVIPSDSSAEASTFGLGTTSTGDKNHSYTCKKDSSGFRDYMSPV